MKYAFILIVSGFVVVTVPVGRAEHSNSATARTSSQIYAKECASCHGKDGRAKTFKAKFNHARDLANSEWQNDVSDERIYNSIKNGKGKKMPGYGKKLTEQEIEGLVSFVRALRK